MIEVDTLAEIPTGQKYVLVKYGKGNKVTRHSRGLTMEVDEQLPDDFRTLQFANEIENARQIATEERIGNVIILRSAQPRA
jgi:hypothetical protein